MADLDAVYRIHADPRTNKHNPAGPDPDREASRARLAEWIDHWDGHGFGYWTVEVASTEQRGSVPDAVVGFSGVRHETWLSRPVLNLYYRFAADSWGRGYASEVARHAVAWAAENHPGIPVLARTKPENIPSQRTAQAAGLVRRHDLEVDDESGAVAILTTAWPN
jgi:RimJ/RimL family protein N-acetyltransferase